MRHHSGVKCQKPHNNNYRKYNFFQDYLESQWAQWCVWGYEMATSHFLDVWQLSQPIGFLIHRPLQWSWGGLCSHQHSGKNKLPHEDFYVSRSDCAHGGIYILSLLATIGSILYPLLLMQIWDYSPHISIMIHCALGYVIGIVLNNRLRFRLYFIGGHWAPLPIAVSNLSSAMGI